MRRAIELGDGAASSNVDRTSAAPGSIDAAVSAERANAILRAADRGRIDGLDRWKDAIDAHVASLSLPAPPRADGPALVGSSVGEVLAMIAGPDRIDVFDLSGSGARRSIGGHGWKSVDALAVDRTGTMLVAASGTGLALHEILPIGEADAPAPAKPPKVILLDVEVSRLALPANGDIVVGGRDGCLSVWRGSTRLARVSAHREPVTDVAVSDDGRLIATCSADGSAGLWRWPIDRDAMAPLRATAVRSVAVDAAGSAIALGLGDGAVEFWRLDPGSSGPVATGRGEVETSSGHTTIGLAFSSRGDLAVASHFDGTLTVWRVGDATAIAVLEAGPGLRPSAAFCGEGSLLCCIDDSGELRVWDAAPWRRSPTEWPAILDMRRTTVARGEPPATASTAPKAGEGVESARVEALLRIRRWLGLSAR